jgi:hypothetical protein
MLFGSGPPVAFRTTPLGFLASCSARRAGPFCAVVNGIRVLSISTRLGVRIFGV